MGRGLTSQSAALSEGLPEGIGSAMKGFLVAAVRVHAVSREGRDSQSTFCLDSTHIDCATAILTLIA
jgi:hypothetical protein